MKLIHFIFAIFEKRKHYIENCITLTIEIRTPRASLTQGHSRNPIKFTVAAPLRKPSIRMRLALSGTMVLRNFLLNF